MTSKLNLIPLLLAAALLCACTAAPQSAATQTPEGLTTQSRAAAETQTVNIPSLQGLKLSASVISDMRVIPSNLDPNTQLAEIITQYETATTKDDQHLHWFIGAPGGSSIFWLSMDSLTSTPNELITLQYPLEVIVSPTEISPLNMNFIAPIYGGGGGITNSFPVLLLQAGAQYLDPDVIGSAELKSDLITGVLYEFTFQCVQPGVYNVHINQTYVLNVNGVLSNQLLPYDILYACPLSSTTWMFDPTNQQVVATQGWAYIDGRYVQQTNQSAP